MDTAHELITIRIRRDSPFLRDPGSGRYVNIAGSLGSWARSVDPQAFGDCQHILAPVTMVSGKR
jgi:hypothetical protein